jgi:restriction endonuclease S subunit
MSFGRPYIMAIEGCIHDGWLLLRARTDDLLKDYLYLILGSRMVYEQFARSATGGVVNNLNIGLVKNVSIPHPPLDVQQQIIDEVEGYQKTIDEHRKAIDELEQKIKLTVNKVWGVGE